MRRAICLPSVSATTPEVVAPALLVVAPGTVRDVVASRPHRNRADVEMLAVATTGLLLAPPDVLAYSKYHVIVFCAYFLTTAIINLTAERTATQAV